LRPTIKLAIEGLAAGLMSSGSCFMTALVKNVYLR
jgi:hypothetical protein